MRPLNPLLTVIRTIRSSSYELAQCEMPCELHQLLLLCILLLLHANDAVDIVVMLVVRIFDTTSVGFAPTSDTFRQDLI